MKTSFVAGTVAILAAMAYAAPAEKVARQFEATVTFTGGPESYTLEIPVNDSLVTIDNDLAVSQISIVGGAICTFFGADGSVTTLGPPGQMTVDVGPPQAQVSGICDNL